MNEARHIGALEAMLFAHAEPVELERLADALRLSTAVSYTHLTLPTILLV